MPDKKYIELKRVTFEQGLARAGQPFEYKMQLLVILDQKQGGMNYEGALYATHLVQKVQDANGWLELDESEYKYLQDRVKEWPIPFADMAIIRFIDAINNPLSEISKAA